MSLFYGRLLSKLTWLATLLALPILLAACGGGVIQEKFDTVQGDLETVQSRVQSLEAQATGLQQRLDRAAAILGVLDALVSSSEDEAEGPSAEDFLEFSAVVQASGTPELQAKWVEIIDSLLANASPIPQEALSPLAAVVQGSGNVQVAEMWQEFLAAGGEGGAAFLELAALIQVSGDPALQGLVLEIVGATLIKGEPPPGLFVEFSALVLASGNLEIQEAFGRLGGTSPEGLPPELLEEIRAKLQALGDPKLEALFEAVSESPGGETLDAFFNGLLNGLRETLK